MSYKWIPWLEWPKFISLTLTVPVTLYKMTCHESCWHLAKGASAKQQVSICSFKSPYIVWSKKHVHRLTYNSLFILSSKTSRVTISHNSSSFSSRSTFHSHKFVRLVARWLPLSLLRSICPWVCRFTVHASSLFVAYGEITLIHVISPKWNSIKPGHYLDG